MGGLNRTAGEFRHLCAPDPLLELCDGGGGGDDCRIGVTAGAGLAVGGATGCVLRAGVCVERACEREAVVALRDCVVRLLQRGGRLGEALCRVLFGTRGTRRVNGPLGQVDLFLRRSGTRRDEHERQQQARQGTHRRASISNAMEQILGGYRMKSVAPHDRPREKLERLGAAALGDNELLAIVLGHGREHTSALDLANAMLADGGLRGLLRSRHGELRRVPGIGAARAAQVLAAIELGRRTLTRIDEERPRLSTPRAVAEYLLPQFGNRPVEQFGVLLLDTKHRVVRTSVLSVGTVDASIVHPREVFREATAAGAAALVLFHNHPSGDPEPSEDDCRLTERLVAAGILMGIHVLDHVILADVKYFSFREQRKC